MSTWTTADMPSQRDRIAIVTGGTEGLGYEDALALARAGASVVIAARSADKGADAVRRIREAAPGADVRFARLDLASLAAVRDFAGRMRRDLPRLDILINNAGIMTPPDRRTTADGFELQFGLNFLGHFALVAELLPLLRASDHARVVSLSSVAARNATMDFDDLQSEKRYVPGTAYGRSKLADLLFAQELQRRSVAGGWGVTSIAAHPGVSRTNLLLAGPGRNSPQGLTRRLFGWLLFQPAAQGALPTLYAATVPDAEPGAYYGPTGLAEIRGKVGKARVPAGATDAGAATRLWEEAERLTGVSFPDAATSPATVAATA